MSRRNKRKKLRKKLIDQLPWQEVVTKFSALEIISQDEIESIHHASLDVLESVGMKVLHQDARKIFKNSGLDVNESSQMVRETPDFNSVCQRSSVVEQLFRKQQVGSSILPVGSIRLVFPLFSYFRIHI